MATGTWGTPTSWTTYLSTELNSLANNAYSAAGTAVNNSSNAHLFFQARLNLGAFGVAPTAGGTISLYMLPGDGTNYSEGSASVVPSPTHRIFSWRPNASTGARYLLTGFLELRGIYFKPQLYNVCGQALAASGNTLEIRTLTYSLA